MGFERNEKLDELTKMAQSISGGLCGGPAGTIPTEDESRRRNLAVLAKLFHIAQKARDGRNLTWSQTQSCFNLVRDVAAILDHTWGAGAS